ncbi:hypothetical protein LEP1GSC188_3575 [Leptospira weilii serovar Topaz str. LT2116]|uniref:Uncharacterized protein n=1 Tax=Leptospira weilii serovar Topaz str. LT2116 TaxID=1088540 RepID=M3G4W5_9LEPT|nr:hypothetical protein LEP1GSC188_3575 [Leptospira weilii serovar Topaz str. LT2116]
MKLGVSLLFVFDGFWDKLLRKVLSTIRILVIELYFLRERIVSELFDENFVFR